MSRRFALSPLLLATFAACGSDDGAPAQDTDSTDSADAVGDSADSDSAATPDETSSPSLIVGVSWNNFQQERWTLWDEPAMRAAIEAAGASYIQTDAGSDPEQQAADLDQLVVQGADVLIVLSQDTEAILPAVQKAIDRGVRVLAYDRLIENEDVFYLSFDNVEIGRMQARAVFAAAPAGNYVIIKGAQEDPNSDLLRQGQGEILRDAIAADAIEIVGEAYTQDWDPANAETNMADFLSANANDVDAVVAANDGTAGGVVAALEAVGLAGKVPVSGQDGDHDALNRVALGTQTVSVWKDARALGRAAGEIALQLARGTAGADIAGAVTFESPGGHTLDSILIEPVAVTRANLEVVLDAGWIEAEVLCAGVPANSVPVCP